MKIVCLGDSLTEGDYGIFGKTCIANVHKENYPYFLAQLSGAEVLNYGKCGYTPFEYLPFAQSGKINFDHADLILLMLGTNGRMNLTDALDGTRTYEKIIDLCTEKAPNAKIVLLVPPHATEDPAYSNCGFMPRILPAVEAVRDVARRRALPTIDLFAYDEISEKNIDKYQGNDGLHFIEAGYRLVAAFVFDELQRLFPEMWH